MILTVFDYNQKDTSHCGFITEKNHPYIGVMRLILPMYFSS